MVDVVSAPKIASDAAIDTVAGTAPASLPTDTGAKTPPSTLQRMFRHRGLTIGAFLVGTIIFVALFAPLIAPHDPYAQDLTCQILRVGIVRRDQWGEQRDEDDRAYEERADGQPAMPEHALQRRWRRFRAGVGRKRSWSRPGDRIDGGVGSNLGGGDDVDHHAILMRGSSQALARSDSRVRNT